MRRTLRGSATAMVAFVLAAGPGCAARGKGASQAPDLAAGSPASSESSRPARPASKQLTRAAFTEDGDGARLVLSGNAPLLYTAYDPHPNMLVVDLPNVAPGQGFVSPVASGGLVQSIRIEPISELGKSITRVTVAYREGARYDIRSAGDGLALAFEVPSVADAASASMRAADDKSDEGPAASTAAAEKLASAPAPSVVYEELRSGAATAATAAPVRGERAHALEEVVVDVSGGLVSIRLLGDGVFQPKDFLLDNPPRVVVDLPGVKNEVRRRTIPVKGGLVSRVRVAQFHGEPDLVTRVVVDLARPMPHVIRTDGERLAVLVGEGATAVAEAVPEKTPVEPRRIAQAEPAPAAPQENVKPAAVAEKTVEIAPATEAPAQVAPSRTTVVEVQPAPPAHASPAPAAQPEVKIAAKTPEMPVESPATAAAPASSEPKPAEPVAVVVAQAGPVPVPAAPPAAPAAPPAKKAASTAKLLPGVRKAQRSPAAATASAEKAVPQKSKAALSKKDDALFEAAAAVLAEQESGKPADQQATANTDQSRTLAESQGQFTGEPISLDLKDADIKDVFRTISQLTGLNIVIDPEVRGTVTVQLEDVPWDQALDLILKQNSLGYVLENNIMRIATSAKLQAEQGDRARLADARQAAEPTRTVIKKLSYARAGEVTGTIKSVMSRRGDIVIDARTNTLIIKEIATYLPAVLQLIENLDTATPQVMIEARIVETTKSLGRSLGINWGFGGNSDVAHGNTTGLIFPNTVGGTFRVPLDAGPTVGAIRLANILNTFTLDIALTAAENQGLLKIISSPKVSALTNTAASIQSGTQIPVQTNVNNTTTVIYVDATLKLTVTPQITAEGTVLLDVDVSKREPAVALNLALGANVPITVRQYKGQILVRDGGTTVIGGIFQLNDQDQNNMIPGLWKIPIFGNLFRNKTRTEKHDELLIFITPRILRQ